MKKYIDNNLNPVKSPLETDAKFDKNSQKSQKSPQLIGTKQPKEPKNFEIQKRILISLGLVGLLSTSVFGTCSPSVLDPNGCMSINTTITPSNTTGIQSGFVTPDGLDITRDNTKTEGKEFFLKNDQDLSFTASGSQTFSLNLNNAILNLHTNPKSPTRVLVFDGGTIANAFAPKIDAINSTIIGNIKSINSAKTTITISNGSFGSVDSLATFWATNGGSNTIIAKDIDEFGAHKISYMNLVADGTNSKNQITFTKKPSTTMPFPTHLINIGFIENKNNATTTLDTNSDKGLKIGTINNFGGTTRINLSGNGKLDIDSINSQGGNVAIRLGDPANPSIAPLNLTTLNANSNTDIITYSMGGIKISNLKSTSQVNVGVHYMSSFDAQNITYTKDGAINLLFASDLSNPTDDQTNIDQNKILGSTLKGGIKITLKDRLIKGNQSALSGGSAGISVETNVDSSAITTNSKFSGILIGDISTLLGTGIPHSKAVKLNNFLLQDSVFLGSINIEPIKLASPTKLSINLDMGKNSKLIITNEKHSPTNPTASPTADVVFQNLKTNQDTAELKISTTDTFSQGDTIIDLATDGNSTINGRDYFRTFTIGTKGNTIDGFEGKNAIFRVFMDPNAPRVVSTTSGMANIYTTADTQEGMADIIRIESAKSGSGTNYIQIHQKTGSIITGNLSDKNIIVAMVRKDASNGFDLQPIQSISGFEVITTDLAKGEKTIDATTYTTYKVNSVSLKVSDDTISSVDTIMGLDYTIFMSNINSLNKRLGELRDNPNTQGVWARVFGGKNISNATSLEIISDYTTLQAGYDYRLKAFGVDNYVGLALGYGMLDSSSDKSTTMGFDAKSYNIEFGLYNVFVSDSGIYSDSVVKFSTISDTITPNAMESKDTSSFAFSFGQEVGYRFYFSDKTFYIDPQAEIILGFLTGKTLNMNEGTLAQAVAKNDSIFALRARAGAMLGYSLKKINGVEVDLRAGGSYIYDYAGGVGVNIKAGSSDAQLDFNTPKDSRFAINVGTNIKTSSNTRIYVDLEKSFGGKLNTDYLINAGFRFAFGGK